MTLCRNVIAAWQLNSGTMSLDQTNADRLHESIRIVF